jgi:nitrogen fixation NifU-like protein
MNTAENLRDIYREIVLEHSRQPRNFRRLEPSDWSAQGHNPLCGDKLTVYVRLDGEKITDVTFEGTGCAISLASASIMTEALLGESVGVAKTKIADIVAAFETRGPEAPAITGDMAALSGVRRYPSRIKCATLAWKTLVAGLQKNPGTVTTEG